MSFEKNLFLIQMADDNFGKWYFDNKDSNVGDIEKRLKNNPEKVNDRDSTTYNTTALMWASLLKRIDIIRWLLDHGAEVNLVDNGNQTALMYAASSTNGDNLPTIQMLIKKGANVDMMDKDGRTALMLASNDTTIRWLINHMSITQERVYQKSYLGLSRCDFWYVHYPSTLQKTNHVGLTKNVLLRRNNYGSPTE